MKRPENGEADNVPLLVVELLLAPDFANAIQQITRQSDAPQTHVHGHHQLTAIVGLIPFNETENQIKIVSTLAAASASHL